MSFRLLTTRERRSVGMPRSLARYTTQPEGVNPLDVSLIVPRRAMVAVLMDEEIERRKAASLPAKEPERKRRKTAERNWPRPGWKIINGKRVYPQEATPERKTIELPPPKKPSYTIVSLDSELPSKVKHTVPELAPRLEGEVPLFELPEPIKKPDDFQVLSASIQFLTNRVDNITDQLANEKPNQPAFSSASLIRAIQYHCTKTAESKDPKVSKFAHSILEMIEWFEEG